VDATMLSLSSIQPQIETGTLVPLVSFSTTRAASLPDVPTILELAPPEKQKDVQALVQIFQLDRNFMAPPNMSPARLKTLRDALDKSMADPELQDTLKKMGRPVDYLNGLETEKILQNIQASQALLQPLVNQIMLDSK
jgi:tripartite-type tricarboxylate transporter receptor subunit TctC